MCKGSAKFRLNEKKTNKFAFLSVRKLTKSSENPKKHIFLFIFQFFSYFVWSIQKLCLFLQANKHFLSSTNIKSYETV